MFHGVPGVKKILQSKKTYNKLISKIYIIRHTHTHPDTHTSIASEINNIKNLL